MDEKKLEEKGIMVQNGQAEWSHEDLISMLGKSANDLENEAQNVVPGKEYKLEKI